MKDFFKATLTIYEDMLGTAPADPEIYTRFVADKALREEKRIAKSAEEKAVVQLKQDAITAEELALLPEDNGKGITVFRRDKGGLVITDTMIRGFLKSGAEVMGQDGKSWGLTQKIDRYIFVTNETKRPIRTIPILRDGVQVKEADDIFERPLRAMTLQGQRVTLAASERVLAPVTLDFHVYIVGLGTKDRGKINHELLKEWFSYGVYSGIGQYRSGGHGRFDAVIEPVEE